MSFSINGETYQIADPSKIKGGARQYRETSRPSQQFEASTVTKSWQVWGPLGNSRAGWEQPLGVDYCDNLDHRYDWLLTSTAARNAIDLGAATGSQVVSPISDVTLPGAWTEGAGNANGEAWDEVDDPKGSPDDATTYWTTSTNASEVIFQMGLPAEPIPAKSSDFDQFFQLARVRNSVTTFTITVVLYEGATTIATNTSGTLTGTDWQNYIPQISQAEMDTITDFNNLRMGVQRASGSGDLDLTQVYTQLPNPYFAAARRASDDGSRIFIDGGASTQQINPSDMSRQGGVGHGSIVTDSIAEWGRFGYVALGDQDLVQKRTVVPSNPSTYANVTGVDAFFLNDGPDRVWVVDGGITTPADKNKSKFALGGLTKANLSNPFQVADTGTTVTGLYTQGANMVIAHTRGVNSFTSSGKPVRLLEVLRDFPSVDNGRCGGSYWGWLYIGTKLGLYAINIDAQIANPVGPGAGIRGQGFEGPVDGYPTAVFGWKDSLWVAYLTSAGETYLFQGRFGPETTGTGRPEWFGFRKSDAPTSTRLLGATALRQNPTLIVGENQDMAYYTMGRLDRDIADADYVFDTGGGTEFLTTLMLPEGAVGNLRWAKFFTENTDSSNAWILAVQVDDSGSYVDVGGNQTTNGLHTVRPVSGSPSVPLPTVSFRSIKPRLKQSAVNNSTSPPQIRGPLTMAFDLRPDMVREIEVIVEWNSASDYYNLLTLVSDDTLTPVAVRLPTDESRDSNTDRYCYIKSVQEQDRTSSDDRTIAITLVMWDVA